MAEAIAGFMPRLKDDQSNRSKAETKFDRIKKNKQALSDNEKAKHVEREKMARLKALLLA